VVSITPEIIAYGERVNPGVAAEGQGGAKPPVIKSVTDLFRKFSSGDDIVVTSSHTAFRCRSSRR
jgi:hypothetical protein